MLTAFTTGGRFWITMVLGSAGLTIVVAGAEDTEKQRKAGFSANIKISIKNIFM